MNKTEESKTSYRESGVDIDKESSAVNAITTILKSTFENRKGKTGEVKSEIGHFANFIEIENKYIVMATDGVGTKVIISQLADKYDTIGIDMIAMNVNDIICVGAEPLSMVDYLAIEKINEPIIKEITKGLKTGADQANIAIIGGETASLKGVITGIEDKGFDLAGTCLGIVDKDKTILGEKITPGDKIIGIESSGIHSNGYSLVRETILKKYKIDDTLPWNRTVSEELLTPTKIYVKPILEILKENNDNNNDNTKNITGLCHITGGGLLNLKRLNKNIGFRITDPLEPQDIFSEIQKIGNLETEEMYRTFNMGMGFAIIAKENSADKIIETLNRWNLKAKIVGEITDRKETVEVPKLNLVL